MHVSCGWTRRISNKQTPSYKRQSFSRHLHRGAVRSLTGTMECKVGFWTILAVTILSCLGQIQSVTSQDADPVSIAVYYETLCPDSQRFVREQLAVVYPQLYEIMRVDINAYGKANDTETGDGGYTFTCQHGPEECVGNQMLACAKSYIAEEKDYVDFNICVMTSEDPPMSGENCSSTVGISVWPEINDCWTSVEGEVLLHDVGVKTHALDPVLDYVPWMVYDGNHTDEIQDQMEHDLLTFVCSNYGGETPDACSASR